VTAATLIHDEQFRPAHSCLQIRLFYLCSAVLFFLGPESLQQCTTYWGNILRLAAAVLLLPLSLTSGKLILLCQQ